MGDIAGSAAQFVGVGDNGKVQSASSPAIHQSVISLQSVKEDSILTDHENDLTEEPEQQDTSESFAKVSVTIIIRFVIRFCWLLLFYIIYDTESRLLELDKNYQAIVRNDFVGRSYKNVSCLISHWCLIAPLTERARVRALRLVLCEFFRSAAFLLM